MKISFLFSFCFCFWIFIDFVYLSRRSDNGSDLNDVGKSTSNDFRQFRKSVNRFFGSGNFYRTLEIVENRIDDLGIGTRWNSFRIKDEKFGVSFCHFCRRCKHRELISETKTKFKIIRDEEKKITKNSQVWKLMEHYYFHSIQITILLLVTRFSSKQQKLSSICLNRQIFYSNKFK